jgi:AcrR family transcriptional regulator
MTTSRRRPRRREILVAAARVLVGREAADMAEVAAAAGIARGTLYRYFPTRESLLRALEAAVNEAATQRLAEANLDQVPVEEALLAIVGALCADRKCCRNGIRGHQLTASKVMWLSLSRDHYRRPCCILIFSDRPCPGAPGRPGRR